MFAAKVRSVYGCGDGVRVGVTMVSFVCVTFVRALSFVRAHHVVKFLCPVPLMLQGTTHCGLFYVRVSTHVF